MEMDEKTASTGKGTSWWRKVKDSRLFAGLVGAVVVLVVGFISDYGMISVGEKEERSRTFDFLSNPEIAGNDLQTKVFDVFVQHVVPALEEEGNDHKKVALLAGLHSNFSEFFDTRSVFEAFAEKIIDPGARHELSRLAKRVARRQAEYIKVHVPNAKNTIMSTRQTLSWPNDAEKTFPLESRDVILRISRPRCHYTIAKSVSIKKDKPLLGEEGDNRIDDVSDLVAISIQFADGKEVIGPFEFDLSYMDTPSSDNIWMRHDDDSHDRVALRLIDIDATINIDTNEEEYSVTIEILHFPGDVYTAMQ